MSERKFIVCFVSWPIHWTMRWVAARKPGYEHVILLSPIGGSRWIMFQWGMDGIFIAPLGEAMAARMMQHATEALEWNRRKASPPSVLHSLLPNTCMTLARQALGLPAKLNFFASGWDLRCELLEAGARVVIPPKRTIEAGSVS